MTSLAEAYAENVGEAGSARRLYLGVGLFVAGALAVVFAILVATTGIRGLFGLEWWQGREVAGVLAGLGIPAVFVGIFTVLPASQRVRAAAAIGAGIAVLGVALFTHAYPYRWAGAGNGQDLTPLVVAVYFLGALVTFWCLFVAVANFKTRNDPGGTVTLEITREGEVTTLEVERDELENFDQLDDLRALRTELAEVAEPDPTSGPVSADAPPESASADRTAERTGLGSVGFVGDTPDGETLTQTAASGSQQSGEESTDADEQWPSPGASRDDRSDSLGGSRSGLGTSTPQSDGGTKSGEMHFPLDDGDEPVQTAHRATDTYCGNCQYFEYVRDNDGMAPYCGLYGQTMDDMDACEQWKPNS